MGHAPELDELQIHCPQTLDAEGFPIDIPNCNTPRLTVAVGEEADALRASYSILNGDRANVTLVRTPESVRRRALLAGASVPEFSVKAIKKDREERSQKEIYTGTPIDLRSVVYVIDLSSCNASDSRWKPALTKEAVQNYLFYNASAPFRNTLANFYTTCSYNKTYYRTSNVTVVGPVALPCRGIVPLGTANYSSGPRTNATMLDWWDFSAFCSSSEQAAWGRLSEAWGRNASLTDPKLNATMRGPVERRRNIYVLPPNIKCPWEGYADVTCTMPICTTFLRGTSSNTTGAAPISHEQMHNYGLEHAGTPTDAYGDDADVMGNFVSSGNGLLCHNAPNMYRIGWATPINQVRGVGGGLYGNLTCANFTAGNNKLSSIVIPAASLADDNMVVVNLGAATPNKTSDRMPGADVYFISYRVRNTTADKYDGGLPTKYTRSVFIHKYNGYQDERVMGYRPTLIAAQKTLTSWTSPFVPLDSMQRGGGLKVEVVSTSDTQAVVNLCRMFAQTEAGCSNSVDDDCDGFTDYDDTDCL